MQCESSSEGTMCAGKLLSLIKKCLHREKNGHKTECHGSVSSSKSSNLHQNPPSMSQKKCSSSSSQSSAVGGCSFCCPSAYNPQHSPGGRAAQHVPSGVDRSGYNKLCPSPGLSCCNDQGQSHCHQQPVVYVPGAPMDRIERAAALQRERQIRLQAIQTDIELNLPPAISISEDGEEGYTHSQRVLQMSREEWPGGSIRVIRPPPNKTVFQGDSPPPYRSNSVNKLDGHYCNKKNSGAGTHHYPGQTYLGIRLACSGNNSPQIARCHSMSAGEQRPLSYSSQNSCPSGAVVCGHYHIPRDSHGASRSYCNGAQSLTHTCHSNHLHSASSQGSTAPAHGPAQNVSASGSPNPHFTALHAVAHNRIVCPQAGAAHSHADLMNTATSQTKSEPGCHGDDLDNQDLGCDYIEPPPNYSDVVRVSSSKTQSAITSVKQLTETSSKEPSSSV